MSSPASLKETYDRFLKVPDTQYLDDHASLIYVTSGITSNGAENVSKQISKARHEIDLKETIVAQHVGANSLVLEISAEILFKNGTSWVVPGLDENFIEGRTIKLPIIKTVTFERDKIRSIRVFWDQATALKQLEVIGRSGQGWPIVDGKHQIELFTKGVSETTLIEHDFSKITKAVKRDSIDLFTKLQEDAYVPRKSSINSAKPPIRDLTDLVALDDKAPERTESPIKTPRRTFSFSKLPKQEDEVIDSEITPRKPRVGHEHKLRREFSWSNLKDQEIKEQSPARLPRAGQAPRRELSFSNLAKAYQEEKPIPKSKAPSHFEFRDESSDDEAVKIKPSGRGGYRQHQETIFLDSSEDKSIPILHRSRGGGIGGINPEETIFVSSSPAEGVLPKQVITGRDQRAHFDIGDETRPLSFDRSKSKGHGVGGHTMDAHFSIDQTSDDDHVPDPALKQRRGNHHLNPHFSLTDEYSPSVSQKQAKSAGANKHLGDLNRNWTLPQENFTLPQESHKESERNKGLKPQFGFGYDNENEKENGHEPVKSVARGRVLQPEKEEKDWWEV